MQAGEQQGVELSWLSAGRASSLAGLSYCSKLHHLQMALGDFSSRGSSQNHLMPCVCKAVSVIFVGEERAPCKLW